MTRLNTFLTGIALGALCNGPAIAQSQDSAIIVTGAGLPLPPGTPAYGSVTIERDRLTNEASGRIEDVLRDIAGFAQFRRSDSRSANPSAQGATLRALGGNASSRALVLLDGVPQSDPFFGYVPFTALVPERLSLIRVTRGGGAGAFGAGAVAGTIEMASAGRDMLPNMSGSAFYGSRDSTELSAAYSPDVGAGFVSLSGRWDKGDGFYTTPAAQRGPADARAAYEGWSAGLRAVAPLSADIEIQARGLVFRDDRTLRFDGADSGSEGQDASIRLISIICRWGSHNVRAREGPPRPSRSRSSRFASSPESARASADASFGGTRTPHVESTTSTAPPMDDVTTGTPAWSASTKLIPNASLSMFG